MNITLLLNSVFIMFIEYNKNDDIVKITGATLTKWNEPDNKVYSDKPYVDNFGFSFVSPAMRGYECGSANCSYNLYSLPNYYIAFLRGDILQVKMVSVVRVFQVPTNSPSVLPSTSPSHFSTKGLSLEPTVSTAAFVSSARTLSRDAAITIGCIGGFLFLACVGFAFLLFRCERVCKNRNSEIIINPNFLNQYF